MTKITKTYYYFDEKDKTKFRLWLIKKQLNLSKFSALCGVTTAYVDQVINGKKNITDAVKNTFTKGGYKL